TLCPYPTLFRSLKESAPPLLALPQRPFRPFALRDVFGERHYEPRHALGARNQRNVVAHPDQAAVLALILLLDLKLFSFSFEQLVDEIPVVFAMILVGNVEKSELTEFLLGVTQHFLVRRVGGQEAALEVCEGDADSRILIDGPPPLLAPRDLQVCLTQSCFVLLMFRDVA